MPLYNFQQQFCPMVKDGSKSHTLRNRRKNPAKVGDTLHLYYGLRSKHTTLLRRATCIETFSVSISMRWGIIFYTRLLHEAEMEIASRDPKHHELPIRKILTSCERDLFAWSDGFRHTDRPTLRTNCYSLMIAWWDKTHNLNLGHSWVGDLIEWDPEEESNETDALARYAQHG